jgi:hypothetical protein
MKAMSTAISIVPPSNGGNHDRTTVVGRIVSVLAMVKTLYEPARFFIAWGREDQEEKFSGSLGNCSPSLVQTLLMVFWLLPAPG